MCSFLSFVMCVAVLNVSCSWLFVYRWMLTGVHFLQCSEYWVMCINVSVIHTLFLQTLCTWYFSNVSKCFPYSCVPIMSIVSAMVPYVCPLFNTWLDYPELLLVLLFLIAGVYILCI
jgi:hypothetical protein